MTVSSKPTTKTTLTAAFEGGLFPKLRDPKEGWKHFAALFYAFVADVLGCVWMMECCDGSSIADPVRLGRTNASLSMLVLWLGKLIMAIFLAAHGRVVAAYLVHDAAHSSVFVEPSGGNQAFGTVCLWLAGCPYGNFRHLRKLHIMHHKDITDAGDYDFRPLLRRNKVVLWIVYVLERIHVPAIESITHVRTALHPIYCGSDIPYTCTEDRRQSARIGTLVLCVFYWFLWQKGALLPHLIAGAWTLQFLAMNDAFQHTYGVEDLTNEYEPGPKSRTAKDEEENTYTTLISKEWGWLNLLALNFGFHNAHHSKPMVPWYALPEWHNKLYGGMEMSQLLTLQELAKPWHVHQYSRLVEDQYGVVRSPGTPNRTDGFYGASGVSFLTV
eukprot:scaffold2257_cov169-Amphora_coffeaeformis.AAC.18